MEPGAGPKSSAFPRLEGNLWCYGPIVRCDDEWGRSFTVWVREFEQVVPSSDTGDVDAFVEQYKCELYHGSNQNVSPGSGFNLAWDSEVEDSEVVVPVRWIMAVRRADPHPESTVTLAMSPTLT